MEKKQTIKIEDPIELSSSFSDPLLVSTGMLELGDQKSSLGFMELLGIQDYFCPSLFDVLQQPSAPTPTSEVLNAPPTPNSSSVSSASSGAPNDEHIKLVDEEEEEEEHKAKKQLKPKKASQKKEREPKFAFMTKSEVDLLEDGYRWRKYGQKAVKNSPFPRSYYRCTSASCNVKKRVERSFGDPTIVVTTYEGQHIHPSPMMPRPSPASFGSATAITTTTTFALPMPMNLPPHQHQFNNLAYLNCGYMSYANPSTVSIQEKRFCTTPAFLRDHGLLQDIVPSTVRKEE